MNRLNIWKDQILFFWDGTVPSGCNYPLSHIKEDPNLVLPFWEHAGPYMRWSKRLNCFMLTHSAHNLQRLRAEFGENITVAQGQGRVEELKRDRRSLKQYEEIAKSIKSGSISETFYKMPPLGRYQEIGVDLLTRVTRVPLFAACGCGKTYMVLVSTQEQFRRGLVTPGKVLVCVKLATLETGWIEDCEKFTHMKAQPLWTGKAYKRREKLLEMLNTPADIYLINHEGVRILEKELAEKQFEKVVIDESTILKSYHGDDPRIKGGKFGKAVTNVAKNAKYRVVMSGTPAPNGPEDLWGQFRFLDPYGQLLERSIHDFRKRFMEEVFFGDPANPNTPKKWVMKKESGEEIKEIISPLSYRLRLRDHIEDMPETTFIHRKCVMSPSISKHYKKMEEELMTEINGEEIIASMKLATLAKLRQITGGFIIDHDSKAHAMDEMPKMDLMDHLLEEEIDKEDKVVIFAQYQWEIETLAERYKNHGVRTVYGGNPSAVNLKSIKDFKTDPEVQLCILHPQSAAHGITFTCAHYMIFYSISYSAEYNYQAIARIERAGQKHPMFIYYLLMEDSIDEDIYAAVVDKEANQARLIDDNETANRVLSSFGGKTKKRGKRKSRGRDESK